MKPDITYKHTSTPLSVTELLRYIPVILNLFQDLQPKQRNVILNLFQDLYDTGLAFNSTS